jgi:hypothetical protein
MCTLLDESGPPRRVVGARLDWSHARTPWMREPFHFENGSIHSRLVPVPRTRSVNDVLIATTRGARVLVLDPFPTLFFSLARMSEAGAAAGGRSAESIDTFSELAEEASTIGHMAPIEFKRKLHSVKSQHVRAVSEHCRVEKHSVEDLWRRPVAEGHHSRSSRYNLGVEPSWTYDVDPERVAGEDAGRRTMAISLHFL